MGELVRRVVQFDRIKNIEEINRSLNVERAFNLSKDIEKIRTITPLTVVEDSVNAGDYILLDGQHRLKAIEILREKYPFDDKYINILVDVDIDLSRELSRITNPLEKEAIMLSNIITLNQHNSGWLATEVHKKRMAFKSGGILKTITDFSKKKQLTLPVALTCFSGVKIENSLLKEKDLDEDAELVAKLTISYERDRETIVNCIELLREIFENKTHIIKGFSIFYINKKENFDYLKFERIVNQKLSAFVLPSKLLIKRVAGNVTEKVERPGDTAYGSWKDLFIDMYDNFDDYRVV